MTDAKDQPPALLAHELPLPPRVDLATAAAFLAAGIAIVCLAWAMPTFYERLQQTYTAPGLVPALHGIVIALLAVWLGLRALARGALGAGPGPKPGKREGYSNFRLSVAALLCLGFAAGLVGRAPFWLATALFVFAFIVLFEWREGDPWRRRARPLLTAAAVAAGAGLAVTLVFEKLFLVRLP
ncbi:MAG: tripartite tricarboxylate transporter TctB family protein [Rhodospirillales bacterium]